MPPLFRTRNEQGSIALTVIVVLVAGGLVMAMLTVAEASLRATRREGNSANALEVADAGIAHAVRNAGSFLSSPPAGVTCTSTAPVVCTAAPTTLQNGGSYTYTATRNASLPGWRIESTGTDAAGQRRRIRADAVERTPFFPGLFVNTNLTLKAGSEVDSFKSPTETCTGKGFVGTNDAASFSLGTGSSSNGNCRGTAWGYPYDGCISYADVNPGDFILTPPAQSPNCPPPPHSRKVTPAHVPRTVYPETLAPGGALVCDGGTTPLVSGTYFYTSVTLLDGCQTSSSNTSPVRIFTSGNVVIGAGPGNPATINQPSCSGSGDLTRCANWTKNLQIHVISEAEGAQVQINNNNTRFWGVIEAPSATLTSCSGCPVVEWWGALTVNKAQAAPTQFKLHYDESLAGATAASYDLRNWVQAPA